MLNSFELSYVFGVFMCEVVGFCLCVISFYLCAWFTRNGNEGNTISSFEFLVSYLHQSFVVADIN